MIHLNVLAEGKTEQQFFNMVLKPHLRRCGVVGKVRLINNCGGWNSYRAARRDLLRWARQDPEAWFTTMVDLYALPGDFPQAAGAANPYVRVAELEKAWGQDAAAEGLARFIPYIQLHEFEALLFADPWALDAQFFDQELAIARLAETAAAAGNPELIDDGPATAPSKRIIAAIRQYEGRKASAGPLTAALIGLPRLRAACRHFNDWVTTLERLPWLSP